MVFADQRVGRLASLAALAVLVAWVGIDLVGGTLFGGTPLADAPVDSRLLHGHSRHVVRTHAYPADYPYPPPAVVFHHATALLPLPAAAALWAGLCGAAAVGSWLT